MVGCPAHARRVDSQLEILRIKLRHAAGKRQLQPGRLLGFLLFLVQARAEEAEKAHARTGGGEFGGMSLRRQKVKWAARAGAALAARTGFPSA